MTTECYARQGEVKFYRVNGATPTDWADLAPEAGNLIVGHSESGHNHIIDATRATAKVCPTPPLGMTILRVIVREPTEVKHLRGFDTHAPVPLEPGEYEVRTAREFDPYAELARKASD